VRYLISPPVLLYRKHIFCRVVLLLLLQSSREPNRFGFFVLRTFSPFFHCNRVCDDPLPCSERSPRRVFPVRVTPRGALYRGARCPEKRPRGEVVHGIHMAGALEILQEVSAKPIPSSLFNNTVMFYNTYLKCVVGYTGSCRPRKSARRRVVVPLGPIQLISLLLFILYSFVSSFI